MPSTATAGRTSFLPFCCYQAAVRNFMSAKNPLFQAFCLFLYGDLQTAIVSKSE